MGAAVTAISRWFGKSSNPNENRTPAPAATAPKQLRRSNGLLEFTNTIKTPGLSILDLGPTSPANITYLTGLGHKVYNEDVLSESAMPELHTKDEDGKPRFNLDTYLKYNLLYQPQSVDAVLGWTVLDFLPEPLVKPFVERLMTALRPGGIVLAFFHDKDEGPNTPYHRYQICDTNTLELRVGKPFRIQRIFNTRHVENLFQGSRACKFFLGQDNLREVLVKR